MMWWGGGHWYWAVVMMIMFWGSIVAIAYFVLRGRANDVRRPLAREILDERFAKGELSEEEYERSRATLEGRSLRRSEPARR
jgi:putative membrane protein